MDTTFDVLQLAWIVYFYIQFLDDIPPAAPVFSSAVFTSPHGHADLRQSAKAGYLLLQNVYARHATALLCWGFATEC
jgi:hypothetical protein